MNTEILISLAAFLAVNIGIAVYVLYRMSKINKSVKNQKYIYKTEKQQINTKLNMLRQGNIQSYRLNDTDKNDIIEAVLECIRLDNEEKKEQEPLVNQQQIERISKNSNVKFPLSITKSGFPDDLSDEQNKSYYRFFNIEGDKANFDFCGTDIQRAIANKVEIEQACEIVSQGSDPSKVENLEKGTVTLKDGKWEVTTKAKINFK